MLDSILLTEIVISSLLDLCVIIFLFGAAFMGYTKGIIVQAISLLALLVGIYVSAIFANSFYETVVDKSNVYLSNLPVIVFAVLFGVVIFFSHWTGKHIKKMVENVQDNVYSKIWGAIVAVVKYLFIVSIIFMFAQKLNEKNSLFNPANNNSNFFEPVAAIAPTIIPQLEFKSRQIAPVELDDITNEPGYIEELDELEE